MSSQAIVVMGVSGCGKSTVAAALAERLGWDLGEGDDLHPDANVAKMAGGHPLVDADRWPWLDAVAGWIDQHLDADRPAVITCSALKRSYRDVLRRDRVVFVYLRGTEQVIAERLSARHDHYMPASLLKSQFATLEPPAPDENALTIDIGPAPTDLAEQIIDELGLVTR
jgi:carbohydrate kinase (thermoresistant glucokinase family)